MLLLFYLISLYHIPIKCYKLYFFVHVLLCNLVGLIITHHINGHFFLFLVALIMTHHNNDIIVTFN